MLELDEGVEELTVILDMTASMGPTCALMQKYLCQYISHVASLNENTLQQVGVIFMDDHDIQDHTRSTTAKRGDGHWMKLPIMNKGMTQNLEQVGDWLRQMNELGGGGDVPEAVACSIEAARRMMTSEHQQIWLVTDAVPHGRLNQYVKKKFPYPHGGTAEERERWQEETKLLEDYFEDGCPLGVSLNLDNVSILLCRNEDKTGDQQPWKESFSNTMRQIWWDLLPGEEHRVLNIHVDDIRKNFEGIFEEAEAIA